VRQSPQPQPQCIRRCVKTTLRASGNREYAGEEAQVAQTIAQWVEAEALNR